MGVGVRGLRGMCLRGVFEGTVTRGEGRSKVDKLSVVLSVLVCGGFGQCGRLCCVLLCADVKHSSS